MFPRNVRIYEGNTLVEDIVLEVSHLTDATAVLPRLTPGFREIGVPGCAEGLPPSFAVGKPLTGGPKVYPQEAKNKREMGRVMYRVTIAADGSVKDPKLIWSAGHLLDQETLRFISQAKYEPLTLCGKAVEASTFIEIGRAHV